MAFGDLIVAKLGHIWAPLCFDDVPLQVISSPNVSAIIEGSVLASGRKDVLSAAAVVLGIELVGIEVVVVVRGGVVVVVRGGVVVVVRGGLVVVVRGGVVVVVRGGPDG